MALNDKQKNRFRHWIRVTMVFVAVLLLFFAVVVPVVNNAIALGVEKDLKKLPLPDKTELVESTSLAGKMVGNGNGMQYLGAILIKSDLSLEELQAYYADYDGTVEPQLSAAVRVAVNKELFFRHTGYGEGYYIVYRWGSRPAWVRDILDTDLRGH